MDIPIIRVTPRGRRLRRVLEVDEDQPAGAGRVARARADGHGVVALGVRHDVVRGPGGEAREVPGDVGGGVEGFGFVPGEFGF